MRPNPGLSLWLFLLALGPIAGPSACVHPAFMDGKGANGCEFGSEGCFCSPEGLCEPGLVCVKDRCEAVNEWPDSEGETGDTKSQEPGESSEDGDQDFESETPELTGASTSSEAEESSSSSSLGDASQSPDTPENSDEDGSSSVEAPSCNDEQLNQNETDVDCGGGICPRCENGKRCKGGFDCLSGSCREGRCAAKKGKACQRDRDCQDANQCTIDLCVNRSCKHRPRPDGTKCNDTNLCTAQDRCLAGHCEGKDTQVIIETFSNLNALAFRMEQAPPKKLWEVGKAKASSCSNVIGLGEDPKFDHTRDGANGVLGVVIGGCSDVPGNAPMDCVWTKYVDVSHFERDLHFSFWRYLNTPGFKGPHGSLKVRNYQYYRLEGDATLYKLKSGWNNKVKDLRWTYDQALIPLNKLGKRVSIGICYKRISGKGSFAGWSVDDVRVRQKGCVPRG